MARLLYVEGSPRKERSISIQAAKAFLDAYKATHPNDTIDVLDVWREYAADVIGHSLDCGHFLPEENPAETLAALTEFLSRD